MKEKQDSKKLRLINAKIKPAYKEEDLEEGRKPSELDEGQSGKGPLVRNYVDDMDMEFCASTVRGKRNEPTTPYAFRLPDSMLFDISYLVESNKTPFRTKSEFFKSAIMVFTNYWANKFPTLKKRTTISDVIEVGKHIAGERKQFARFCDSLEETIKHVKDKSDKEIHNYILRVIEAIDIATRGGEKKAITKKFKGILEAYGIDPGPYFEAEDKGETEEE